MASELEKLQSTDQISNNESNEPQSTLSYIQDLNDGKNKVPQTVAIQALDNHLSQEKADKITALLDPKSEIGKILIGARTQKKAKIDPMFIASASLISAADKFADKLSEQTGLSYEESISSVISGLNTMNKDAIKNFYNSSIAKEENQVAFLENLFTLNGNQEIESIRPEILETYKDVTMKLISMDLALRLPSEKHDTLFDESGYPQRIADIADKEGPKLLLHALASGNRLDLVGDSVNEWQKYQNIQDQSTHVRTTQENKAWAGNIKDDLKISFLDSETGKLREVQIRQPNSVQDFVEYGLRDGNCFPASSKHPQKAHDGENFYLNIMDGNKTFGSLTFKKIDIEEMYKFDQSSLIQYPILKHSPNADNPDNGITSFAYLKLVEMTGPANAAPDANLITIQNKIIEGIKNNEIVIGGDGVLIDTRELDHHYLSQLNNNQTFNEEPTKLENYSGIIKKERLEQVMSGSPEEYEVLSDKYDENNKPFGTEIYARSLYGLSTQIKTLGIVFHHEAGNKQVILPEEENALKRVPYSVKISLIGGKPSKNQLKEMEKSNLGFETVMQDTGLKAVSDNIISELN